MDREVKAIFKDLTYLNQEDLVYLEVMDRFLQDKHTDKDKTSVNLKDLDNLVNKTSQEVKQDMSPDKVTAKYLVVNTDKEEIEMDSPNKTEKIDYSTKLNFYYN